MVRGIGLAIWFEDPKSVKFSLHSKKCAIYLYNCNVSNVGKKNHTALEFIVKNLQANSLFSLKESGGILSCEIYIYCFWQKRFDKVKESQIAVVN